MAFRYKVIERCFREAKLMLPGQEFITELAQPSRALEPLDEETRIATKAKADEYAAQARQVEPVSQLESMALRDQNKALADKLEQLSAQLALVTQAQVAQQGAAAAASAAEDEPKGSKKK